jgi:hydrogenase maturation protease
VTAPILVFGWGNPSRGDDALGPLFVERIEAMRLPHVECLTDFQLQVEHALDLQGRQRVLFVDASMSATAPFAVSALRPRRDASFTSHALSPEAVLQAYRDVERREPPPAWLVAIHGDRFDLGSGLSAAAADNLAAALTWARDWLVTAPAGDSCNIC